MRKLICCAIAFWIGLVKPAHGQLKLEPVGNVFKADWQFAKVDSPPDERKTPTTLMVYFPDEWCRLYSFGSVFRGIDISPEQHKSLRAGKVSWKVNGQKIEAKIGDAGTIEVTPVWGKDGKIEKLEGTWHPSLGAASFKIKSIGRRSPREPFSATLKYRWSGKYIDGKTERACTIDFPKKTYELKTADGVQQGKIKFELIHDETGDRIKVELIDVGAMELTFAHKDLSKFNPANPMATLQITTLTGSYRTTNANHSVILSQRVASTKK